MLQDAVHDHHTGLGLLLAPEEGERGEEVDDRAARQIIGALRSRYEVVVVDCGSQMQSANAAAVELADVALLVTTPDVVAVRAAKRQVRLWDRLQIRKAEETITVVNRLTRNTEIQPPLVAKATGTQVARTHVPAAFKELQPCVDAGRMQDLDGKSTVKQALWALAGELGLVESPAVRQGRGSHRARPTLTGRKRKAITPGAAPGSGPGQGPASGSASGGGSGSGIRFGARRGSAAAAGGSGPFDPAGPYDITSLARECTTCAVTVSPEMLVCWPSAASTALAASWSGADDLAVTQPGRQPTGAGTTDGGGSLVAGQQDQRTDVGEIEFAFQTREDAVQVAAKPVDGSRAVVDQVAHGGR